MSKQRKILSGMMAIWGLCFTLALQAKQSGINAAPTAVDASQAMNVPFDDLKWQAIVPEMGKDSPEISVLRVDPKTQATQLLIRIPTAMHVPTHWHSANETHTMIKGTAVFEHGGNRHELGPGGFNYIPAKTQHQAWCSQGSVVFITVDGAWDVNWVNGPPVKKDLGQVAPAASK